MKKGGGSFGAVGGAPKRAAVLAALCLGVFASPFVFAHSPQDIEATAARAIKHHDIQADMPKDVEDNSGWRIDLPDIDAVTWILWCAIAFGVAFVLYPLRDQLFFGRMRRPEDWDGQRPGVNAAQDSPLAFASAQAEEMARQGRYREAIHLLLLHALNEMHRQLKAQFADSLTSREILRAAKLPAEGNAALQDMIGRVEKSYFGEYPTSAEDYAGCRASFDIFKLTLDGRGR
jgi:hypothetical protein